MALIYGLRIVIELQVENCSQYIHCTVYFNTTTLGGDWFRGHIGSPQLEGICSVEKHADSFIWIFVDE